MAKYSAKHPQIIKVKKSRWLRGEGGNASCLLRETDEKMCCIGFLAKARGIEDETMSNVKTLSDLDFATSDLVNCPLEPLEALYEINDLVDPKRSAKRRISSLNAAAKKLRADFRFRLVD